MPTREEMIRDIVDQYKKFPDTADNEAFAKQQMMYDDVITIKGLLEDILKVQKDILKTVKK